MSINLLDIKLKEETAALMNMYGDRIDRILDLATGAEVERANQGSGCPEPEEIGPTA